MSKQDFTTGSIIEPDSMGYYYLHTNGELIYKPYGREYNPIQDFEESPFVVAYWLINTNNRADAYNMLIRANMLEANHERIDELLTKWNMTNEDTKNYCKAFGIRWGQKGELFTASAEKPETKEESAIVGEASTLFYALCDFYEQMVRLPEKKTEESKN